ncbi:MAG: DUF2125 domain-containing protein [Proteobacteria bacterium]|nr:DUF2125 domain-containing protein [Pseudomonadota bacterium]
MNYSHRFWLFGPVGLFAILMLGVMGYWWITSSAVARKLDAINGHEIAPGIKVSFARKAMSGFPFRVDSELDGLRVEIPAAHGPMVWTAEHFAMHALTYNHAQFIFEAAGQQVLTWRGESGVQHIYRFLPGLLRASAIAQRGELSRFDLDLLDAASPDVSAARFQLHLRKDPKIDGLDFVIEADGVHIAPDLDPAFGSDIKSFRLDAMMSPGASFDGLLGGHADWRAAMEDWRTRHGGVLVNTIAMNWGKLAIAGKGAMAVDEMHRPMGALRLRVDDWQPLVQQAQQRGWLKGAHDGLAAGFFALAGNMQGSGPLAAMLGFKDGVMSVGSIPAGLLSPLY